MNQDRTLHITLHSSLKEFSAAEWNPLVSPDNPFMDYEFLCALEESGSVGEGTSWQPRYFLCRHQGRLVGALPFYVRWDSFGEFVFDWSWAQAYARAGFDYYPKLVVGVPFTPANGDRFLVHPEADFEEVASELVKSLLDYARSEKMNSIHVLFLREAEAKFLEGFGFGTRLSYQYHWKNENYAVFDDFLADLHRKKRHQIRKERSDIIQQNLEISLLEGEAITPEIMKIMAAYYRRTMDEKNNIPYLKREFFDHIQQNFRHRTVMVMARHEGEYVGGTLNFTKGSSLYGRYWGAERFFPSLHFECCFYQLIEYSIQRKIQTFEAGAQGEQKFLRGFAAFPTYSSHWMAHPGFHQAILRYVEEEGAQVRQAIIEANQMSPLKRLRSA